MSSQAFEKTSVVVVQLLTIVTPLKKEEKGKLNITSVHLAPLRGQYKNLSSQAFEKTSVVVVQLLTIVTPLKKEEKGQTNLTTSSNPY